MHRRVGEFALITGRRFARPTGALMAVFVLLAPDVSQAQGVGRVRGLIFDSLSNRPLSGATVLISGSERIGVTDDRGRFDLDSIAVGKRTLTFSTPSLDSLGLFTLGRDISIAAGQTVDLSLNTPSFATVWKTLCPRTPTLRGKSPAALQCACRCHRERQGVCSTEYQSAGADCFARRDQETIAAGRDRCGGGLRQVP